MLITFNKNGYTKQGKKFVKGTHEVLVEDYVEYLPYAVKDTKEVAEPKPEAELPAAEEPVEDKPQRKRKGYKDELSGVEEQG